MGVLDGLPTLSGRAAERYATPKHAIVPTAIVKQAKKKLKSEQEAEFRAAVWRRDRNRSRASGKPLAKSGSDWDRVGEVHHVLARSTDPDKRLDPSNGILLSKSEHRLAETVCPNAPDHCLLDIVGPEDRSKPQLFLWRDVHGVETKRRQS